MTEQERTGAEVLAVPLPKNDANAATVRDYLLALLAIVWREEECFNGKRPFGNSGWTAEVYGGLLDAGMIDGQRGSDGWIEDLDYADGERLVQLAIAALAAPEEFPDAR